MPRIRGAVCTLVVATALLSFASITIPLGGASAGTPPSIAGYENPLRSVVNLVPNRIDQGVDYTGMGKVYALGPGVITYVDTTGAWFPPAPDYIAYQLTSGTASGLTVYVAECITPKARIQVGLTVGVNTVIGNMTTKNCGYGIETGWANANSLPDTMAAACYNSNPDYASESGASGYGMNFSHLLRRLGAPPGQMDGPKVCPIPASAGMPVWQG